MGTNGPLLWNVPTESRPGEIAGAAFAYDGTIPWDDFWTTLETQAAYLDVHTTAFPEGQIRGALDNRNVQDWYCPSGN